jgi:hypothetical protein
VFEDLEMIPDAKTNDQILDKIQDLLKQNRGAPIAAPDIPSASQMANGPIILGSNKTEEILPAIPSEMMIKVHEGPIVISPEYMEIGRKLVMMLVD